MRNLLEQNSARKNIS